MKIVELTQKESLDNFFSSQKHSQFLQSFEWGEFQKNFNDEVVRLGLEEGGQIKFAIQLIKKSLPFGKAYFYAPRIETKNLNEEEIKFLFGEIKKISEKENVIFLRMDPLEELHPTPYTLHPTIDIQAKKTLILNISRSEEEIMNAMHQKTRYNIRLAGKKGVIVREGSEKDFEDFWYIMEETSKRDGFRLHLKKYYKEMINLENIKLLVAEYEGKIIAGVIISFFGDMGSYVHGASANEFRNVMAPYALQWEVIKLAKQKNCKYYDFNGIDEKKWPGVTRFKMGFARFESARQGGEVVEYPGTFDMVFDNLWYNVYKLIRRIRRLF